ncbi:MAG: carboxypeptidase-like regulatory domain-containing protein [Bacteroidetes bacterium]|nr:carboxypeptidase-like regulatory domain-containing protein [Bacteroidota bacterium]
MLRNLLITIGFVLATSVLVFSQTGSGTLKGKIIDKATKEPISFANVVAEVGGVQIGGSTSDFDGNFTIKPIPPGKVDLKASFVGYKPFMYRGIYVTPDKITFQNLELEASTTTLNEIEVVDYKVPLISKDQTTSGGTVTSEEISKMANKSASSVATTVGGVSTDANGNITSMRGQRSSGTVYFIDGMRVTGSNATLPQSAIEQVEVILGGTPAAYGDATGGIINVTTKGPSKDFSGGVDLQTSQYLDAFGYNRLGLNFTGPLVSKKDTVRGYKTPIMGFFIAGDLIYQKDGAPAAFPLYRVTDDVLNSLSVSPLRLNGQSNAVEYNSEYLTYNQLETTKSTLNSAGTNINVSGKLDFRVSPTINFSMGGTFTYYDNFNFNYANTMMNWQNNSHSNGYTWRVNGRFTQRFPTAVDSKNFVKNIYYSIGADFTRSYAKTEDAEHKDNYFEYGYIGSFATQSIRAYTPTPAYDSVAKLWGHLQNGVRDTIVVFNPSDLNVESANWTKQYYGLFDDAVGHYQNIDEIISGKGLVNGMEPVGPYNMFAGVGNRPNTYFLSTSDQVAVNASFAADFGNHEIQLGLQYQQRKYSGYANTGIQLWEAMRGLTNAQLKDLNLSDPQPVYRNGVYMDTINYYRNYVQSLQRNFDINLRKKLGLPIDGSDWIDMFSYNFANNTINYYDKNQQLHTLQPSEQLLSMDMFNAEEILNNGAEIASYYGYDYTGKKLSGNTSWDDFFTQQDASGNYTRAIGPYQPIYIAGYIQDKFAFKDLIFNIGIRVDRFDANQPVLKDPYLFYPAKTRGEVTEIKGVKIPYPDNIGNDYVLYVNDATNPTSITGYRNGSQWYNAAGYPIANPKTIEGVSGIQPYLVDPNNKTVQANVFKDYDPQTNWMPRISFSFPISDDALFYAHYDILTQRPSTAEVQIEPIRYYYIGVTGASGQINNPALVPEKTIDYELGFQQKINNSSSLKLAVFYREMRDQIQQYRLTDAYPKTYYSYTNIDFGTVKGLTITYDLRRSGNARLRFFYTLQFADGTGSDPNASATIIRTDQPNLRTLNPLDFDRRHQFNISFDYRWGGGKDYNGPVINRNKKGKAPVQILSNLGANLTLTGGSGTPYTQTSDILPYGNMGRIKGSINGARLPWQFLINARFDKDFNFALNKKNQGTINVYIEFANLLNSQNVTAVYPATGDASDDGFLTAPEWQNTISIQADPQSYRDLYSIQMNNPYRYSSPRTIRLGLMFNF